MKRGCTPLVVGALLLLGLACNSDNSRAQTQAAKDLPAAAPPAGPPPDFIPEYARDEARRYVREFMAENAESATQLTWRFLYDESDNACLEFTVSGKPGYQWPKPSWIGMTWREQSGSIGNGEIHYSLSMRKADAAQFRLDERRKEAAFRELEALVLQVAQAYDYDFQGAYGRSVKYRSSSSQRAVCDGYADAVGRTLSGHPLVASVEKWGAHDHAWNVVRLKDGRRLFCDATWYDGNEVDDEGFVVEVPRRDPVSLTFDEAEFNSLGGAVDKDTGQALAVHFAWKGVRRLD